jgi:hypothetical protein
MYVAGLVIGAAIAVIIIGAVRGRPAPAERTSAEGGALPIHGGLSGDGSSQAGSVSDS